MEIIIEKLLEIEALIKKQYVLSKDFLTLEEAADYLQLSKSTLYKFTSRKKIPYYIPTGKIIYFRREELDEWLMLNRITTEETAAKEVNSYLKRNLKP